MTETVEALELEDEARAGLPHSPRVLPAGLIDGAAWVLDGPPEPPPIWGHGLRVLWVAGEPLLIVGPEGAGKTTALQWLALGRMGLVPTLLGLPVAPSEAPVLLLAADRPAQQRRSIRRFVGEVERETLTERLIVHKGLLPVDVVRQPESLAQWVADLGVGTLLVDSLGALWPGLKSEEVGAPVGIALSLTAQQVPTVALFHTRKATADNRHPETLADVYGSRWLTSNAGSVVLLAGDPGDPIVRFRHLKQPAEEVGPFEVAIDAAGFMARREGTDLFELLRAAPNGLTAKRAAELLYAVASPTDAQREKGRRRLDGLVERGAAHRRDGKSPEPNTYFAISGTETETLL